MPAFVAPVADADAGDGADVDVAGAAVCGAAVCGAAVCGAAAVCDAAVGVRGAVVDPCGAAVAACAVPACAGFATGPDVVFCCPTVVFVVPLSGLGAPILLDPPGAGFRSPLARRSPKPP
ncbi:hypothetical protein C5E46_34705 [Nocardia nova]|nr:hypothetical protein C5E46_34705 [Nocardia nova]